MSGESTLTSDLRKPVKVKKPKAKAKPLTKKIRTSESPPKSTQEILELRAGLASRASHDLSRISAMLTTTATDQDGLTYNSSGCKSLEADPLASAGKDEHWTVILLCTDRDSFLKTFNPYGPNCRVVEVTVEDDFTTEECFQRVYKILTHTYKVAVFVSMPCTGGCAWNMGVNSKLPHCQEKLNKHWKLLGNLWEQFERLVKAFPEVPTVIE